MAAIEARGALFDLDGTLINSLDAVERHWREFADWYGLDPVSVVDQAAGMNHVDHIRSQLHGGNDDDIDKAIRRFEELEVADAGSEVAMQGAAELLDSLPPGSFTIVTACWRELAVARTNAAGLKLPSNAVTSDQVPRSKPAPDGYLLGAKRLDLPPQDCVVFEDSVSGIKSAIAADCQLITLLTTTPSERLAQVLPAGAVTAPEISAVRLTASELLRFEISE